jgi:arabinofuranan 3-O-arabinosyltransferase
VSWIRARTSPEPRDRSGRANLLTVFGLVALSLVQGPGSTTFDTKFDLTADPGTFLARTLHLWNPELSFGELQNQAYGYLFPQGTFFLGGDVLGIPDWIVQRLWSALILVAAYEGARRLFRALSPAATSWLPILAGLAYALAPRLLGLSGVLTAEVLPTAVLPWVVLPLVHALHGRMSVRRGALLSGAAVLFMGGVNAVENLATLPLPALLILCALRAANGRRLALWWVAAVSLACAWWMLPLLVLGKYSPPFLDYIETSRATTRPLGWTNATRGADHWLAYINVGGEKWWPGAFDLATEPHLIALTALVAAVSLAGVFHPSMPARLPLALSVLLGLALLTIAHVAPLSSPLSGSIRDLLDGSLALLRNVHKVDPLVRLPMALGFAHAVSLVVARASYRSRVRARPSGLTPAIVIAAATALLLLSAQPLFDRDLRKPGWDQVPKAWYQTADYLAAHSDGRRALVLPGSSFGQQNWGWTIDEPIQGVARTAWVARSQVPLVPGQTIRFLDSIEDRIQDGRGSSALADTLARAGIGYVVVRRDLDLFASGSPSPTRVDQAILRSPGLIEEARFGSTGFGDQPAISVYSVRRTVPRVEAVDLSSVAKFAGGPEDVITLLEAGALAPGQTAVVSTEPGVAGPPDLVADGYRLRERQFGRLHDSLSQIMTRSESFRNDRRAHDYPGVAGITRTDAVYPDISGLSASSSSGYADTLGEVRPELGPYSAVDGIATTYWRSAPLEKPSGQWLQVRLKQPQPLPYVDVTVGVDGYSGVPVRRIRVDADGQVSDHAVDPETGTVRVLLSGAPVDKVRVTVLATLGDPDRGVVAIREISLPGLSLGRDLAVHDSGATGQTGFVFAAQPERRACVRAGFGPTCEAASFRPSEEEPGLYRTFHTDSSGVWSISGTVTARASPETAQLLWPIGGEVKVGASSVLADDPSVSGQFAFDGDPGTSWLSARGDVRPSLVLRWDRPRTLTRLRVLPAQGLSRIPTVAKIESGGNRRRVELDAGSFGLFAPLRTDHVTITFPMEKASDDAATLPAGVGDLVIDGLKNRTYAPDKSTRTGAICGLGPDVVVDGRTLHTRVTGSVGDVIGGSSMRLEPCGRAVHLSAGDHELAVASTDRFLPTMLTMLPTGTSPPAQAQTRTRTTDIKKWQSTSRAVVVGPGAEALLRVPENVNAGWQATLNGRVLVSTRVDGWQQAYRIPAGEGGLVRLTYTPDRPYRTALLAGAIAAGLLLVGCIWVWRRERRTVLVAGDLPAAMSGSLRAGPAGVPLLVVAWLAGGVALLVGTLVGLLLRRRPTARRWVAIGVVGAVGVAAGLLTHLDQDVPWNVLDAATGGAIGLLLAGLTSPPTRED